RERDQFGCIFAHGVRLAVAPPIVDADILPDGPTQLLQALRESRQAALSFRIVPSKWREHPNASHPLALLRTRRKRPSRHRAAEQRYDLAPLHSIPSSARTSRRSGTVRPSALAVLRLRTVSYLTGTCTGRSAGLSPRRMRSA